MKIRKKVILGGVAAVALTGAGASVAFAHVGDDAEQPITGEALAKASAAALAYTGGGRVTETETGDEDSYYEVEVTLPDGRQVDVQLDADFKVVGSEADDESEDGANDE